MINLNNKVGAVGFVPRLFRFSGARLAKYDIEEDCLVKSKSNGFCIDVKPGEAGELLCPIDLAASSTATSGGQFIGYTDPTATEKKIIRDAFTKGDAWFRTGDLLRQDKDGYYFFVDRIGDTFRWKGENVATSEVAEVLSSITGIDEANVYGVSVAGYEGRAGMAAIVVNRAFHSDTVFAALLAQLPPYARPLFFRVHREIEKTTTFKYKKVDAVREGFDPSKVSDPLFFLDEKEQRLVPLDKQLYEAIVSGQRRV